MIERFNQKRIALYFSHGQLQRGGGSAPLTAKFVVVAVKGGENEGVHFVAGPVDEYRYHAQLVMTFCRQYNIPAAWKTIDEHTEVDPTSGNVLGGGWMDLFCGPKKVKLYGSSKAYGDYDPVLHELLDFTGTILDGFTVRS